MADLREMIYCPYCASTLVSVKHEGLSRPTCPTCHFRQYANPVPAVNVALVDRGKILLVRRGRAPFVGSWVLPGGFIEWAEDPEAAAIREALEETGIRAELTGLAVAFNETHDPRGNCLSITYPGRPAGDIREPPSDSAVWIEPRAGDDAAEALWIPLSALPSLGFPNHQRALEALGIVPSGPDPGSDPQAQRNDNER